MLGWSKKGRTTHIVCVMDPASQWYLAGTLFHCLESATMAPASKTPKPNRWLNSSPTPFMVQWKRLLASYSELRLEVSTVRCWMSRHVNIGLKLQTFTFTPLENKKNFGILKVFFESVLVLGEGMCLQWGICAWKGKFYQLTLLRERGRKRRQPRALLPKCQSGWSCIFRTGLWWPGTNIFAQYTSKAFVFALFIGNVILHNKNSLSFKTETILAIKKSLPVSFPKDVGGERVLLHF